MSDPDAIRYDHANALIKPAAKRALDALLKNRSTPPGLKIGGQVGHMAKSAIWWAAANHMPIEMFFGVYVEGEVWTAEIHVSQSEVCQNPSEDTQKRYAQEKYVQVIEAIPQEKLGTMTGLLIRVVPVD